ncbi:FecR family protein [Candidatus Leptofilum sp.]|uniref:FecR family protein n=1 Tax=Candidatus Leptofilum sp. TaxID=3241576 RepID=UPI003B5C743F
MFIVKMGKKLGLAAIALAVALSSVQVFAAESSGIVVASRGAVSAFGGGQVRTLSQGDQIYVDDRITTGDKSFAVLQFIDGAKVTVRPNSSVVVEEYVYNNNEDDEGTLNLVEGGLRIITGAMAKSNPESYKVRTPVALMGVRGTEFAVMLCGDEVCDENAESESGLPEGL